MPAQGAQVGKNWLRGHLLDILNFYSVLSTGIDRSWAKINYTSLLTVRYWSGKSLEFVVLLANIPACDFAALETIKGCQLYMIITRQFMQFTAPRCSTYSYVDTYVVD